MPEIEKRLDQLSELRNKAGASYTFYQAAQDAIAKAEDPKKVDWQLLTRNVAFRSMSQHGQKPEDVKKVLLEISPGVATAKQQADLIAFVEREGPELERQFDVMRHGKSQTLTR